LIVVVTLALGEIPFWFIAKNYDPGNTPPFTIS
jgi:hypothetical protein